MMRSESCVDKHCVGCKYYYMISETLCYCSYIFQEDKRRPCPPGKDCTVKKKKRKRGKDEGRNIFVLFGC